MSRSQAARGIFNVCASGREITKPSPCQSSRPTAAKASLKVGSGFSYQALCRTRKLDDGERTAKAIRQAEGKRLLYREPAPKA
ncbi:MAG: hypothetical protein H0U67_12480 [Gemmatimonadetes bacterium]|nr:hypothetical protein [Gemmatimonadota bacterium]